LSASFAAVSDEAIYQLTQLTDCFVGTQEKISLLAMTEVVYKKEQ
jgi:hypothetical protein